MVLTNVLSWMAQRLTGPSEPRCYAVLTISGRKYRCEAALDHPTAHVHRAIEAAWYG